MRPLPALTAVLPALLLGACAPLQQIALVPQVEVQGVRLTSLTLPGGFGRAPVANLTLNLRVTNPNPLPLRVANLAGSLIIDGANVGDVTFPNVALPARGSAEQLAQVSVPVTLNTAASFLKVARGQLVTYRVDGGFTADFGPLGLQQFGPFTLSQGQWKQDPIIPF
ncbi:MULTISPECIES: LEA type 2 family protein [Deinococcus]|uniref:LEA14-like dessication related protein n=4 Tax=Deinococcus TaxID=1298 RepID=A0A0F7JJE4_9DEIO|nr:MULTISPECIES: LEA type 2 family protein [Deinococcus]AKH16186.1 Water stress and hypersensitive response domain-containing protein [Deinococcus soli (ex Cha et al. 2016)]MDK2011799.1 LEA type 2 family protein [Deinococcus sp. 43]MDR6216584.1 LEA14-like dessication related protein [Deinococcus soli (ex Cha et al. 2016)]MDR6327405.1 LEA14-like dessication related protein [Deinococcus soli (ex Cha et al. 2016)]MDR6749680.1 LEA14-like dessication related protein [Deinococcus soli (ex Cha et al.